MALHHRVVERHRINLNHALRLETAFIDEGGSRPIVMKQELILSGFTDDAIFRLNASLLTPEVLRNLATELENGMKKATQKKAEAVAKETAS